ncbi:MAG: hypothetical protein JNL98_28625 [Bryobacterales bacterium]|nr:hypothetical protein [Bryobacterales bacterium]
MLLRALTVLAFYLPASVCASLLMNVLPVVLVSVAAQQPLGRVDVRRFGIFVQSTVWRDLTADPNARFIVAALIPLLFLIAISMGLRRYSARCAGLLLAAGALSLTPLWFFFFNERQASSLLGASLALLALALAQRWLIEDVGGGYLRRVMEAFVSLAAAAAVVSILPARGPRGGMFLALSLAPLLLSSWIAPLRPPQRPANSPSWQWIPAGVLLSAMTYFGLPALDAHLAAGRHLAVNEQLRRTPAPDPSAPYPKLFFQRGISVVADRESFGSDPMRRLLDELAAYQVDSIAIVTHNAMPPPEGSRESAAEIELLSRWAHQRGMKVLLKPHHRPRGNDLDNEASRAQWFERHAKGMEEYAKLATRIHADLFCIGYEMGKAYQYSEQWRQVIARVRRHYAGPLTAGPMQGEEFEKLDFWDALDYIGIDNYYPLPDNYDYSGVVAKIETVQQRFQKPVLFTEAGFASTEGVHREPWAEPRRKLSHDEQVRCYRALLEAVWHKPWFQGVYWWKVDTDGAGGMRDRSLTPWRKPAMELVKEWYSKPR